MNILDDLAKQNALILEQQATILAKLESLTRPSQDDDLMTVEEVAAYFGGKDITTIYAWAKAGKIKMYGLKGSRFFKRGEIKSALIPMNNLKKVA